MRTEERIRAVRRVRSFAQRTGPSLGMNCRQSRRRSLTRPISPQRRRLASAKDRVAEALALLPQWLKEAEANDEGGASE